MQGSGTLRAMKAKYLKMCFCKNCKKNVHTEYN